MELKDYINEAISSGKGRSRKASYPDDRRGRKAKYDIQDFLEDMGFERVEWDRKWLLSTLSDVAKSIGKDIYSIPLHSNNTVVAFTSKDSDKTYRIDTNLNVKDTTNFMDPGGPLTRWWRDEHGSAMVIGFTSLEKFWDDVEKEYGW
jgi:hypothetical protein